MLKEFVCVEKKLVSELVFGDAEKHVIIEISVGKERFKAGMVRVEMNNKSENFSINIDDISDIAENLAEFVKEAKQYLEINK